MLRITADVFSGRPNPEWIIEDEQEAQALLKDMAAAPSALAADAPEAAGLGFRGVTVEPMSDELARDNGLAPTTYIAADSGSRDGKATEIIERIIALMGGAAAAPDEKSGLAAAATPELQQYLREQLQTTSRVSIGDTRESGGEAAAGDAELEAAAVCFYDSSPYNPGFWNTPTVQPRNNCYNYASNKRTDTFAQPGRGCGRMYTAITCPEMTRASLCDGLHRRYTCFPASQAPRYLVALVVAPGPGFVDFHWYRRMREGFWGHKPGGTAARNTDNSGLLITNPATCNRGPYTHFCGYFYTCKSQKIK